MKTYTLNYANGQIEVLDVISEKVLAHSFTNAKGELRLRLGLVKKDTNLASDVAWTDDALDTDYIDDIDEIEDFLHSESLSFVDANVVNEYFKSL